MNTKEWFPFRLRRRESGVSANLFRLSIKERKRTLLMCPKSSNAISFYGGRTGRYIQNRRKYPQNNKKQKKTRNSTKKLYNSVSRIIIYVLQHSCVVSYTNLNI